MYSLRGHVRVYKNGKPVFEHHNDITPSFVLSLVKAVIGTSSAYGGLFTMPSIAVLKAYTSGVPTKNLIVTNASFYDEVVSGLEKTYVSFLFTDNSKSTYSFDYLELWTAVGSTSILEVSEVDLGTTLTKNPIDTLQVEWVVEMRTGAPFNTLSYAVNQIANGNCNTGDIGILNFSNSFSVFNLMFSLLTTPNIVTLSKQVKSPLTNFISGYFANAHNINPQGLTSVICLNTSSCTAQTLSGTVSISEFVGENYVYVAVNVPNVPSGCNVLIPVTTINVSSISVKQYNFGVAVIPNNQSGNIALVFKIPFGQTTRKEVLTHQGV